MTGNPMPMPTPAGGYETPSAGVNWKLFLLVAGIIGIVLAAFALFPSGEKDGVSADIDGTGADVGQSGGPDNLPGAVEDETRTAEKTSIPEIHFDLTDEEQTSHFNGDFKENTLYFFEDENGISAIGVILDKNKLSGLEFDFEEMHASFSMELKEYKVIITSAVKLKENARTKPVLMWQCCLLDKEKNKVIGTSRELDRGGNAIVQFTTDQWQRGKFIYIDSRRVNM